MDMDDYQRRAWSTAIYPDRGHNFIYPALGLCGEAGEVAEKIKKALRDDEGRITHERREALVLEMGDILWYLAALARELDLNLGDIAAANIAKLSARQTAGKLHGQGDRR